MLGLHYLKLISPTNEVKSRFQKDAAAGCDIQEEGFCLHNVPVIYTLQLYTAMFRSEQRALTPVLV